VIAGAPNLPLETVAEQRPRLTKGHDSAAALDINLIFRRGSSFGDGKVPSGKINAAREGASDAAALGISRCDSCHGLCGSQKYTSRPVSIRSCACWAISAPWSQVNDRRSCSGSAVIAATIASRTASAP
jgi:hypothetical protein